MDQHLVIVVLGLPHLALGHGGSRLALGQGRQLGLGEIHRLYLQHAGFAGSGGHLLGCRLLLCGQLGIEIRLQLFVARRDLILRWRLGLGLGRRGLVGERLGRGRSLCPPGRRAGPCHCGHRGDIQSDRPGGGPLGLGERGDHLGGRRGRRRLRARRGELGRQLNRRLRRALALLPVDPGAPAEDGQRQGAEQGQHQHPPPLLTRRRHIDGGAIGSWLALLQIFEHLIDHAHDQTP